MKEIYNKIYRQQLLKCIRHSINYSLSIYYYNAEHDAVGCAYYKIKELYPNNKELINYAYQKFLE